MGSVRRVELWQDALHVRLDCSLGDLELGGDQLVRLSRRHSPQHFELAHSQCIVSNMFGDFRSDLGGYATFAGMHGSDGLNQFLSHKTLEQVAGGAGPQSSRCLRVARVSRQYDDASIWELGSDGRNRLDATHIGHTEVHERHVGPQATKALDCLLPIAGLPDQRHIRLIIQHCADSFPQELMIVDGKYPNCSNVRCDAHGTVPPAGVSTQCGEVGERNTSNNERTRPDCGRLYANCAGTRRSISVPTSGLLQITRRPPSFFARSCSPMRPKCPGFPPASRTDGLIPRPSSRTLRRKATLPYVTSTSISFALECRNALLSASRAIINPSSRTRGCRSRGVP